MRDYVNNLVLLGSNDGETFVEVWTPEMYKIN